jgi:hypothetical protein
MVLFAFYPLSHYYVSAPSWHWFILFVFPLLRINSSRTTTAPASFATTDMRVAPAAVDDEPPVAAAPRGQWQPTPVARSNAGKLDVATVASRAASENHGNAAAAACEFHDRLSCMHANS